MQWRQFDWPKLATGRGKSAISPWAIVGTVINGAPLVETPAVPVISAGILYGAAGIFLVKNLTQNPSDPGTEYDLVPPVSLTTWGEPGDAIEIYRLVFSGFSPEFILPGGTVLSEDFGAYTAGSAQFSAQLDALYFRQTADIDVDIQSDATSPGGNRISIVQATNISSPRYIRRDDTLLPDGSWSTLQIRGRARIPVANDMGAFGWGTSTGFYGIHIGRSASAGTGRIAYVNNGDMSSLSAGTALLTGIADAVAHDFLIDIASNKRTVSFKAWATGGSEPEGWMASYTLGADVSLSTGLRQFVKVSAGGDYGMRLLAWKLAIDTNAPAF